MNGFDLVLEKKVFKAELQNIISNSFNIPLMSIVITDDYIESPLTEDIKIWCMLNEIDGDFLMLCQFFIRDNSIIYSIESISKKISYFFNCKCLIPDDSINPLKWIMIFPDGAKKTIFLDSSKLDNDIYVISN